MHKVGKQGDCDSFAELKRCRFKFGEAEVAETCGTKEHKMELCREVVLELSIGLYMRVFVSSLVFS